jgi:hypothetical protein
MEMEYEDAFVIRGAFEHRRMAQDSYGDQMIVPRCAYGRTWRVSVSRIPIRRIPQCLRHPISTNTCKHVDNRGSYVVSQWRTTIGTGAHPRVNGRPEQLDLQALRRVRERLVSQRTGIVNQIRAFTVVEERRCRWRPDEQRVGNVREECARHFVRRGSRRVSHFVARPLRRPKWLSGSARLAST